MLHKLLREYVKGEEPFKNDLANRKEAIANLTKYVSTIEQPYVIAIDGKWGSGKTTFVEMWRAHLLNQGFHAVMFNAWEADHQDAALLALIAEFQESIKKPSQNAVVALAKARTLGIKLGKRLLPATVKLATGGIVDLADISADDLDKVAESVAEQWLKEYEEKKRSLVGFRDALTAFAQTQREDSKGRPIIYFIDELDRCRPDFAISILEAVKHLFSVQGVIFVLSIDKPQIAATIRGRYGSEFDAVGYLRRFIDIEYRLPAPELESFVRQLIAKMGFEELLTKVTQDPAANNFVAASFAGLARAVGMSLRDVEQAVAQINVLLRTANPGAYVAVELIPLMLTLSFAKHDLYTNLLAGRIHPSHIVDELARAYPADAFFSTQEWGAICGVLYTELLVGDELEGVRQTTIKEFERQPQNRRLCGFVNGLTAGPQRRRGINDITQRLQFARDLVI